MAIVNGLERERKTGVAVPPKGAAVSRDPAPPAGTKPCMCTPHHAPPYARAHCFFLRTGEVYWLCPTSREAVKDLLKEYARVGGEPDQIVQAYFTRYQRHIANRTWFYSKYHRKHAKIAYEKSKKKVV